jgi:phage host-nuclease inhibitor protein Gam
MDAKVTPALPPVDAIKNDQQLSRYSHHIGHLMRVRDRAIQRENAIIARVQKRRDDRVEELETLMVRHGDAIRVYSEAHQERLTGGAESKKIVTPGGSIRWFVGQFAVFVTKVEEILKEFERKRGLRRFIRIKKELNKELMLEAPNREMFERMRKKIPGLTFRRRALFYVQPAGTECTMAYDLINHKWEFNSPPKKK